MKKYFIFFLITWQTGLTQPFYNEILAFKKQDSLSFPEKGQILFIGSSSFTLWKEVQNDFPLHRILNRGFGGSTISDLLFYFKDIVIPYQPKQIVVYCGENDIANDSLVTGKVVFRRFVQLYDSIRFRLGNIPVVYISMKPSPSRWHLRNKMREGNLRIRKFTKKKHRNLIFVDVWSAMLNEKGEPKEDIYQEDKLHMNRKGYEIWKKMLEPLLLK
ncbi:MAG: GDSL-type esterase/lipase family protein [Chitinophagaceae bacterium]|nr:GDSL-type esterase/lipase family protein [Chitinophagaceae bacterium]